MVTDIHPQCVTVRFTSGGREWTLSAVYGSPIPSRREELWGHLAVLRGRIEVPWCLMGDFNEVLYPSESKGSQFHQNRANKFSAVIEQCRLIDLGMVGGAFTWVRRTTAGMSIQKRLDRALGDLDWRNTFPEAFVENVGRFHSDHSALILHCSTTGRRVDRSFRFLAAWSSHDRFQEVVQGAWIKGNHVVPDCLQELQNDCLRFNREVFGNIFQKKRSIENRLRGIERALERYDSTYLTNLEKELRVELETILMQEELLWFQKARENWIRFGDRNTRFFHMNTIVRRKSNKIHRLLDSDGLWHSDDTTLSQMALRFYKELFAGNSQVDLSAIHPERVPSLSQEHQGELSKPVSFDEVRCAVMSMGTFKAPGPDGFQPFFYKSYWDLVGSDIVSLVQNAFANGYADARLTETLIVLIPKVPHPSQLREFRPISLCNVSYKVITKVIAARMRPLMSKIVGPLQSSFIPDRGTSDNVLVA